MPPREPSAVRPPARKLLGFPALSNDNSPTQLIALSTAYPWYGINTALQSTAPYKSTKRAKTKHHYYSFISVSSLLKCPYTLRFTRLLTHALIRLRNFISLLNRSPYNNSFYRQSSELYSIIEMHRKILTTDTH